MNQVQSQSQSPFNISNLTALQTINSPSEKAWKERLDVVYGHTIYGRRPVKEKLYGQMMERQTCKT